MYLNDKLLKDLHDGKTQVYHTKYPQDLHKLNIVLCAAFPDDGICSIGESRYYRADKRKSHKGQYIGSDRCPKGMNFNCLYNFFTESGNNAYESKLPADQMQYKNPSDLTPST